MYPFRVTTDQSEYCVNGPNRQSCEDAAIVAGATVAVATLDADLSDTVAVYDVRSDQLVVETKSDLLRRYLRDEFGFIETEAGVAARWNVKREAEISALIGMIGYRDGLRNSLPVDVPSYWNEVAVAALMSGQEIDGNALETELRHLLIASRRCSGSAAVRTQRRIAYVRACLQHTLHYKATRSLSTRDLVQVDGQPDWLVVVRVNLKSVNVFGYGTIPFHRITGVKRLDRKPGHVNPDHVARANRRKARRRAHLIKEQVL